MSLIRSPENPESLYVFYSGNGVEMWFNDDNGNNCEECVSPEAFEDLFHRLTTFKESENSNDVEFGHEEYENEELRYRPYVKKDNILKDIEEGRYPKLDADLRKTIIFKGSGNELRMWDVTLLCLMRRIEEDKGLNNNILLQLKEMFKYMGLAIKAQVALKFRRIFK